MYLNLTPSITKEQIMFWQGVNNLKLMLYTSVDKLQTTFTIEYHNYEYILQPKKSTT